MVSKNKQSGFTLIELLVVISIIALLMSILVPALSKVKEMARRTVCASGFRQVGIVYHLYANDYNTWLMRGVKEIYEDAKIGDPIDNVVPYILKEFTYTALKDNYDMKDENWVCPALRVSTKNSQHPILDEKGELEYNDDGGGNYGFGEYRWLGIAMLHGLANMQVAEPSTVEESSLKTSGRGDKVLAADLNLRWDASWEHVRSRVAHDKSGIPDGGNRVLADGSVEWFSNRAMAKDDTPINQDNSRTVEGKYDHKNGGRAYFW